MLGSNRKEHHPGCSGPKEVKSESCCGKLMESDCPKAEKKCCKTKSGGKNMQSGENIGKNLTESSMRETSRQTPKPSSQSVNMPTDNKKQ